MIQFPVIRRIEIHGYELFQNDSSKAIRHNFDHGVHAVVGINGLGKTTLLTILYRVLLGPFDQRRSDDAGLLGSQHEVTGWRNAGYFRDRVTNAAKDATVEADIAFGGRLLTVRRRLDNLLIDRLKLDQIPLETSQEKYQETVVDLSGTATFFDFFAILRYLIFFLEDRVELIWDRRSQFDMLRILLFDRAAAKLASQAYDAAQSADSRYRNRRNILNRDRDRLKGLESAAGHPLAAQLRVLQTAIAQAEERDQEQAAKIEAVRQTVEDAKLRREKTLLDSQEARNALELEEQAHYQHLFPDLGQTAQYVFLNILGGGGCLVCGSTGEDIAEHLRAKLDQHRCPICDSPAERHEKVVAPAEFSRARLRRLKAKVDQLKEAIDTGLRDTEQALLEHKQLVERRDEDRKELSRLRADLAKLGPIEVPDDAEIDGLRAAVSEGERALSKLLAERTAAEAEYGRVVGGERGNIDKTANDICARFSDHASLVLTERCALNITKELRAIGQDGETFEFPYFEVQMTSGVFDQSMSVRSNPDAVSESQREFLDIAFRLALIQAVTKGQADSMLVLETPESSLDSLFVAKAGEVFRYYGEDKKRRNVLIASTNLNNEDMLGALLGTWREPPRERRSSSEPKLGSRSVGGRSQAAIVPPKERSERVINLLDLAAPNAALRQHRQYYTAILERAMSGGARIR